MIEAPGVVVLTHAEKVQLAAPPMSVMGLSTTTDAPPDRLTALPNFPPETIVAAPMSVPFIAVPPLPPLITVEPETLSNEYEATGWIATAAAPAAGFNLIIPALMIVGPVYVLAPPNVS